MRLDAVENLICREVVDFLEAMAREAAQGNTTVDRCLQMDFEAVGVSSSLASAALQQVAGRIR